ncbi:hypothetical protein ABVK25_000207 [Lepraria finkii]|uniref:F-box domain-containing protein n=1 Tax=Lepraria finkii TaxID=1340010 RepID=A0ABR4BMB9_9LECA
MAGDTVEELERFRQQWHEEVSARSSSVASSSKPARPAGSPHRRSSGTTQPDRTAAPTFHKPYRETEEADEFGKHAYHDLENQDELRKLGEAREGIHPSTRQEPSSALEHYERAVEKETQGNLGDSLSHYRKAYRLDAGVDRLYKNKHFPPSSFKSKPTNPNPSNAAVTVPNPAHHSLDGPPHHLYPNSYPLFSSLSIPPAEPPTDVSPPPPCPFSTVPSEILINVLLQTAITDVASFTRLSLVCKRLAYLVSTEDRIWKDICLGPEVGFAGMHYKWARTITGGPLPLHTDDLDNELPALSIVEPIPIPDPFPLTDTYPTYKRMFHLRPRLRFNGCYISTVKYIRPGGNTASQVTFNTPVHIVTYYRYLRFFRDGTCASLLTTTEPGEVVHHLTKENMHTHHAGGLPSAVMNNALRGRWKLSGDPYQVKNDEEEEDEGIVHIQTEGADAGHPNPKYIYKMALQLMNARKGAEATRNNKLVWMGYWSYNKLTADWAEFGLKNDKAFIWSRVRSYGGGE